MTEEVKTKKSLSKKAKVIIISCVAVLLIAIIITVSFVFFIRLPITQTPSLEKIRETTPYFEDDFKTSLYNTELWDSAASSTLPRRGGYWTPDALSIANENLCIRTYEENGEYYTGGVISKNEFCYGYYEFSAKLPKGHGIWSALWLLNDSYNNIENKGDCSKYGAEIDIMEAPLYPQSKVQSAVHKGNYTDSHSSIFNASWLTINISPNIYENFTKYALYWTKDYYIFYINDQAIWKTDYNNNVSQIPSRIYITTEISGYIRDDGPSPEALGPSWAPKAITANEIVPGKTAESSNFDYLIDYVRVYNIYNEDGSLIGF